MTDNDKAPAVTGASSENLDGDSTEDRTTDVSHSRIGGSPDDPRLDGVSPTSVGDGQLQAATETVDSFIDSIKDSGTLFPGGRLDSGVIAAAALLAKHSDLFLDDLKRRLCKIGIDSNAVEDWVWAVTRRVHGRSTELVSARDLIKRSDPEYLIDGVLEMGSFAMLYAESGVGKTFVVLSWCFCIAGGLPWLGRGLKKGPAIYIAAEGVGGLAKRLRALTEHYDLDDPPPDLYVIEQSVNLLSPMSMAEAITAAEDLDVHPNLVVFDTYARSMAGGDENSAKDVGLVVAAIDDFRFTLDTAVSVVHHTTKTGVGDRGSGALTGAVDTKILVREGGGHGDLTLDIEKQKNFEGGNPIHLTLEPVGESLVPVERAVTTPGFPVATGVGGKDAALRWALLEALQAVTREGNVPIGQTQLIARVIGNTKMKSKLLQEMADDPDSPIIMQKQGKRYLYHLDPNFPPDSDTDSESIPPSP